jgi:hypothetical protein
VHKTSGIEDIYSINKQYTIRNNIIHSRKRQQFLCYFHMRQISTDSVIVIITTRKN